MPSTPDQHKLVKRNTKAINHSILVNAARERDKLSSSSSYDRLSSEEINSPSSSTESSSSAPSKLTGSHPDPPSGFPRRGLMEILQEESASMSSKTRHMCGDLAKPLPQRPSNRSISALVNPHTSSYPPNSAFPHVCDRKEATYVLPGVNSTRKHISVKAVSPDHVEIPHIRTGKQGPVDSHIHSRMGSQFDLFVTHSMSFKRQNAVLQPPHCVPVGETVNLDPKSGPDTESPTLHEYVPRDESAEAVFHLEQESRMQMRRSQLVLPNRLHRNVSKNNLDCLHGSKPEKSVDDPDFSANSNVWPRNSHIPMTNANYYGAFVDSEPIRPQKTEKRTLNSNLAMYNQGLRNSPDHSTSQSHGAIERSNDMQRRTLQNDTMFYSLTQCGCIEMGDLRCKNSILCTIHTIEEKLRVPRPRDLKPLIHEARQRQHQNLMRLHEVSAPTKMRRVSPSSPAVTTLPTASYSASPDVSLMLSTPSVGGAVSTVPSTRRLSTVRNAPLPSHHVSVNGVMKVTAEGQSFSSLQQQQPTILHRRVHHPSSLLRRNQQMWGQEKPSTSFSTPNANATELYATSGVTASVSHPAPSTLAITKLSRNAGHLGAGVMEVQSRVVVNDEREKSITGRSRKSSRSGMRQPASSMHNQYIQHLTAVPTNLANSTAVLLRASATNQIAEKLRGAPSARESAGIASTTAWMGFNRPTNASDPKLAVPNSSTTTACRKSNSNASVSTAVANPHAFGSNRWIFIGPKRLNKTGSANRLPVVPGLSLIQAPYHHQNSQPCSTPPIVSAPMSLEASLELMDPVEETDVVDVDAEGIEAELEAAAAASTIASTSDDTNSIDNYRHQQQQQAFSRTSGGGGKPHSTNVRPSPRSVPPGQMLVFQTRRM